MFCVLHLIASLVSAIVSSLLSLLMFIASSVVGLLLLFGVQPVFFGLVHARVFSVTALVIPLSVIQITTITVGAC